MGRTRLVDVCYLGVSNLSVPQLSRYLLCIPLRTRLEGAMGTGGDCGQDGTGECLLSGSVIYQSQLSITQQYPLCVPSPLKLHTKRTRLEGATGRTGLEGVMEGPD